ncbi:MAG: hypothetical protein AAF078_07145, partial [Planctomycetota bacterium]
ADRATLMADAGKFSTSSTVYFGELADVDAVIVDDALPAGDRAAIRDAGVELTLVSPDSGAPLSPSLDRETAA